MSVSVVKYLEPLQEDERAFLKKKETRDRRQLYRTVRIIILICFILPFGMAWGTAIAGLSNPFSYGKYFTGVGVLLFLTTGGVFMAYRSNLYRIYQDLHQGTKTVERTIVTKKRFMPHTNTCYFYLDSPEKLSIEVSPADYEQWDVGDEVNIEYSTHAKAYFGYF